jgi:hypothetical protein
MNLLDDLIYDLNTLAEVKRNSRIDTSKDHIVIEPDSLVQGIYRWKSGESRDKTMHTVHKIIMMVIELTKYILESRYLMDFDDNDVNLALLRDERIKILSRIYEALFKAQQGIKNLAITYEDDADAKYKFDKIIELIDYQLNKLKNILYTSNYNG